MQHRLEAHRVFFVDRRLLRPLAQAWIKILAGALQRREPGVVVEPGAPPRHLLIRDAEVSGQLPRCSLHAVAKTHDLEVGRLQGGEREDRHRIRVVHDQRSGSDARDVADDVEPCRPGAKRLEDAARFDGVADALVNPVTERYLVIGAHVSQPGNLDRVDHIVGTRQHVEPLRRRLDLPSLSRQLDETFPDSLGEPETDRVHVDERERPLLQAFDCEDVGHQLARENRAARANERDFGHAPS